MSVSQLVKRQEGPQMCLEGPGRCTSTMDALATPQSAHKGEVERAKGRPTTSNGCPTLHEFAKYIIQCPTKIKDVPYAPQKLHSGTSHVSHIEWQRGTALTVSICSAIGHPFYSQSTAAGLSLTSPLQPHGGTSLYPLLKRCGGTSLSL
jgi:hypothetical protein